MKTDLEENIYAWRNEQYARHDETDAEDAEEDAGRAVKTERRES